MGQSHFVQKAKESKEKDEPVLKAFCKYGQLSLSINGTFSGLYKSIITATRFEICPEGLVLFYSNEYNILDFICVALTIMRFDLSLMAKFTILCKEIGWQTWRA